CLPLQVHWVEQQVEQRRVKRDGSAEEVVDVHARHPRQFGDFSRFFFSPTAAPSRRGSSRFPDPLYSQQWYLSEGAIGGYDMNVGPAWARGYTGKGVVISILDDGIQHNHPDIAQNYDSQASTDINDNDPDPMPRDNGDNRHGTRCAGEVAAVAFNDYCGVGVAYNSSIGGVRMLDGTVNDAVEARAISLNPSHIDIYSASWGPEDDGKTVDGPGPLAKRAFINGVIKGRHGKGSIFVWASGNGGRHTDNCNCDGYTNSIFTLSISSASQRGYKPWYLEECSSTLATTYSSGTPGLDRSVATVDMDGNLRSDHMCTVEHTGTSASAPLAAGVCALGLEANPDLTWRDMQHLVVMSSRYEPLSQEDGWFVNGNGRRVSHKFGYGLMDAGKLVELAEKWTTVPPQHVCQSVKDRTKQTIPTITGESVIAEITTDGCAGTSAEVRYLEHVQARVSLRFLPRGNINIKLVSPSGTTSTLLFERPRDVYSEKFDDWPFLSVHFWGEKAAGTWRLIVTNAGTRQVHHPGVLMQWQLILHGTREPPGRLRSEQPQGSDSFSFPQARPTQSSSAPLFPSRRPSHSPLTISILDQILAGSTPDATYATADGKIIPGPNQVPAAENSGNTNNKFFESEVCHSQCLGGCSGPGPDKCKACHHYSLEGECVGSCPEGTYGSEDRECLGCDSSCALCSGPAQNQCVACHPSMLYVLHLGICVETCPEGYYPVNGTCVNCGGHCTECTGQGQCNRCSHNLLLSNGTCTTRCPDGYFETDNNSCGTCYPQCLTCVGGSNADCASCRPNSFLHRGKCVYRCPKGTYGDAATQACLSCPSGCASCTSDSCTSCIEGWRTKSGRCVARSNHCHLNEYASPSGACEACHPSCLACIGTREDQCLHCAQQRFLMNSQCVQTCPSGFFAQRGRCLPCAHGCETCSSYTSCSSCSAQFYLHVDQCVSSCPDGTYSDRGVCSACDASCKTCYGPRADQCALCQNGSFLLDGTCHQSCPESHYPQESECLPCYHNCKTCRGSGLNDCTSCRDYLTLDGGMCIECRSGRYYNLSSQRCEPCSSSCLTCSSGGERSCTSCQSPKSLHTASGTCRICCPPGILEEEHNTCCSCDPLTGQCYGAVSADKRRIALSLKTGLHQTPPVETYFSSVTYLVVVICSVNLLIFGAVFTVLQARSTGSLCWRSDYDYSALKNGSMSERVSLTLTPYTEDDSEDERENELLYMKT
ncbi:furin-like protease 2, partial [Penaeus japonicus]|uniref:furin-like protease 2 n=1 Tax=Penaeus japonicus TaxID=27405 RepID=UPI001C70D75F